MNAVVAAAKITFGITAFLVGSSRVEPSYRRVVIVRSRVNYFARGAVRQVHARAFVAETELQHSESGNLQPLAQCMHSRRDVAQILREERQTSESLTQLVKQIVPRTIHPSAVNRSRIRSWNLPELVESSEMIKPYVVAIPRGPSQPLHPPVVASRLHHIPAIKRITPTLSGLAEKIRRNARDYLWFQSLVQLKQVRVRPHICAIVVHKDRDIADNTHRALRTIFSQRLPLLVESKLQGFADLQ